MPLGISGAGRRAFHWPLRLSSVRRAEYSVNCRYSLCSKYPWLVVVRGENDVWLLGRIRVPMIEGTGSHVSAFSKSLDGFAKVQIPTAPTFPHTREILVRCFQQLSLSQLLRDNQQTHRRRQGAQVRFNPPRQCPAYARYGRKGRYRLGRSDIRRRNQPIGFGK